MAGQGEARPGMAGQGGARRGMVYLGGKKKNMKTIEVCVEGTTPLLMNRFLDRQIDTKGKKRTGAIEEFDLTDKLYLVDGKPQVPGIYFRNSIVEAAKQFKITGKGKSTYSKLAGSTVQVKEEYVPILPGEYEAYRIAAVNPMTKGRMMVTRPRFNKWKCRFNVELLDDALPPSVLNDIIQQAGSYVGIGDWRPDKKGMFGKFMLTSFQEKQ